MKLSYPVLLLMAAVLIAGCSNPPKVSEILPIGKADDGWEVLFDGKTLDGWRGYNGVDISTAWMVDKGIMFLANPPKDGPHANIITEATYDDFDLRFDFRLDEGTNSGVMFNVGEGPKEPYLTGPEYQVLDNLGFRSSKGEPVGPSEWSGSHYAIEPPLVQNLRPIGEWNQGRIVVQGNYVQYWLNGAMTAEYIMHSAKWNRQIAESKFSKWKDFCTLDEGHIALQDHGHRVWFTNIRIKRM